MVSLGIVASIAEQEVDGGPRRRYATPMSSPRAVTFDFGQTLAELDAAMLSARLLERGLSVPAARIDAASPGAWQAYDQAIAKGVSGHPWKTLMSRWLELAGAPRDEVAGAVDFLWEAQPTRNLWRRPIPGMIEIVRELRAAGIAVAVLSNSEGRLAELVAEIGWGDEFAFVADSGRLGFEKPDPRIFHFTAERLGVAPSEVTHVGDSLQADVLGAVRAGMRAIWFRPPMTATHPAEGVTIAQTPADVRSALL
jgi:putative hydrolase of the HAD superfamily